MGGGDQVELDPYPWQDKFEPRYRNACPVGYKGLGSIFNPRHGYEQNERAYILRNERMA